MQQLKEKMKSIVKTAIVTYVDFDVGTPDRFHILRFNPDPQKVIEHIKKYCMDPARPDSGGQGHHPEDATGALNEANKLPWKAANRVIFHIADAPGHHTKFGNANYPNGKPGDPQPEELMKEMDKSSSKAISESKKSFISLHENASDFSTVKGEKLGNTSAMDYQPL